MITVRTLSDLQAELPTIGAWLLTDTENGRTTWKVQDAANASGLAHSHAEAVAAIVAAVNEQHDEPVLAYEAPDPDDAVPLDEEPPEEVEEVELAPTRFEAPDPSVIPDQLAGYALADEAADDFRKRAFQLLFRFGIADGENFEGGGEPLTADEKISLLPMLIANFEAGNWLNLQSDLKPS